MGIWILDQNKAKLTLCKNIIIDQINGTNILEYEGIVEGAEKYTILGTYKIEECKNVLSKIVEFLLDRGHADSVFKMPEKTNK